MPKFYIPLSILLFAATAQSQIGLDYIKNKAKDKVNEKLDKKQKEFDESNFNYAILFLDNSGEFEADEKGLSISNSITNSSKLLNKSEKTVEERAYTSLRNGELLYSGNRFYLAEQSFRLAKLLYEESGATATTNYGQTIGDLALLYQSKGMNTKAKEFSDKALVIRQQLDNKGMLLVAVNNSAVLKKASGLYPEAETQLKEALGLAQTQNDKLASALVYNNLAMTYLDMNKLTESLQMIDLCLADAQTVIKETESNFVKLLINKANILRFSKKYEEAESIYIKSIEIKEKRLGAHPDLAHLKMGLAQLYMDMGKTDQVEALLTSAYDINRRKLGEKNPATLAVMQQQANYYRYKGDFQKALDLITKVVAEKKVVFGEEHPNYVQALEDLAIIQWQINKIADAKINYKQVLNSTLVYINTFFNSLNESEKNSYWDKTTNRLQGFYAFAAANYTTDPELGNLLYNTVINTKGFLLNTSSKIKNSILSSGDAALMGAYTEWQQTKEALNMAYQLSKDELSQEKVNLDSLKTRSQDLEKELSKSSALFRESVSDLTVSAEQIQKLLKPTESVIEILEINEFRNGFTGAQNYLAMVVRAGSLQLIELGKGEVIEKAVKEFRDKTIHTKPENEAYGFLWKSLESALTGCTRLYMSLDGAYHKVSLSALKDAQGKYLADKFEFTLMGNSRDLVSIKESERLKSKPQTAQLFGNPYYGNKGLVQQLDGTEIEVKNIAKLLNSLSVKTTATYGKDATENALKALRSPSILHIATHGYFLADVSKREGNKVLGVDIKAASENPLLRSGLLLANCENVYDENYHPVLNAENGVLTAYEAMNLSLENTDLVVLSACETGLGSIKQGEGVYGLQRAFLIAGAKSIIMSLWSVSDDATMELMTLFYSNYAKTGDKSSAFNSAIKQLKLKYKQPFYWSAFVLLSK
jgi:CHAT domain-containing protein